MQQNNEAEKLNIKQKEKDMKKEDNYTIFEYNPQRGKTSPYDK